MFGGTVPTVALWFKQGGPVGTEVVNGEEVISTLGIPEWAYFVYIMVFLVACLFVAINVPKKTELELQHG